MESKSAFPELDQTLIFAFVSGCRKGRIAVLNVPENHHEARVI
jgi:hypothetical protein